MTNTDISVLLAGLRTFMDSSLNRVNDTVRREQEPITKSCSNCGAPFDQADWSAGKCSYCGVKIFGEHPSVASYRKVNMADFGGKTW